MSAFRVKPTPELLERIVANYHQTGDVVNAAIRSGVHRTTFYIYGRLPRIKKVRVLF
jgi:hypothetical protein